MIQKPNENTERDPFKTKGNDVIEESYDGFATHQTIAVDRDVQVLD